MITGGAGFIGTNLVARLMAGTDDGVVVLDRLTYAGHAPNLNRVGAPGRVELVHGDIADRALVADTLARHRPRAVLNLAAETHVDRSIDDAAPFIHTNVLGTQTLLDCARAHWRSLPGAERGAFRLLHVSTDEVYGSLGADGRFTERSPYAPTSPYAASKAAADHLVRAAFATHGLPVLVTNCSNNLGPFQFPEKLVPLMILNALEARPLPVYGDGLQVRDWIHVADHCDGLLRVLDAGVPGESYNLGADCERTNLEMVESLCEAVEAAVPAADNPAMRAAGHRDYGALVTHVPDRPGHDRRYALDATRARRELGFAPAHGFADALAHTVRWYADNRGWCEEVAAGRYRRERLGLGDAAGAAS